MPMFQVLWRGKISDEADGDTDAFYSQGKRTRLNEMTIAVQGALKKLIPKLEKLGISASQIMKL